MEGRRREGKEREWRRGQSEGKIGREGKGRDWRRRGGRERRKGECCGVQNNP